MTNALPTPQTNESNPILPIPAYTVEELYRVAKRYCVDLPQDIYDDAVQEFVIAAYDCTSIEAKSSVRAMQYEFGVGAVLHFLRRENRYHERHKLIANQCEPDETVDEMFDALGLIESATPESALESEESNTRLLEAVEALSAEDSAIIFDRFYHGKTNSQIAAELGVSEGTVRYRLKSALKVLRGDISE